MTEKTEALAKFRLVPSTLGEAMEMAQIITGSGLCPAAYVGKPKDAIVAYEFGAALGLSWTQSLKHVAVINGITSIFGDAIPAIIYASGQCERFYEGFEGKEFDDDFKAVLILKRKGYPDERRFEYSVRDAKTAKLWGKTTRTGGDTPWITNPKRMLRFRNLGFGARDVFSDHLHGLILAEEAMDYPEAIDATVVSSVPVTLFDKLPDGLRDNLERAFETLAMSGAQRLAKINEFLGGAGVDLEAQAVLLLEWCRDEYAKRKTGQPRKAKDVDNGKKPAADVSDVRTGSVPPVATPDVALGASGSVGAGTDGRPSGAEAMEKPDSSPSPKQKWKDFNEKPKPVEPLTAKDIPFSGLF